MTKHPLESVFGVSKSQILSYVERPKVDGALIDALKTDKQVIVYGSSKQGKTSLVDKHLPYSENLVFSCTPTTAVIDIYRNILRKLGIELQSTSEAQKGSTVVVGTGARFKAMIPFIGSGEASAKGEIERIANQRQTSEAIEVNLALPQDVSDLLQKVGFNKRVILENFHYLTLEAQRQLAFDLRAFQELGVRFVVLGVWREKNRLTQFNGDLLDRIFEVAVEPWEREDFYKVIALGEAHLNISMSPAVVDPIINNAFDSIGVVQELLKATCRRHGILQTADSLTQLTNSELVAEAIREKAKEYASRHVRALENIAEGRKAKKATSESIPLHLPYYTVRAFLGFEFGIILRGVRREELEQAIKVHHHRPEDVRPSDMSNLLHGFAQLQSEKNIVPPIFDYDQSTRTMRVVDSTFYFFLRNIDRDEVLQGLDNPVERAKREFSEGD